MMRWLAGIFALLHPLPALALSCLPHDFAMTFQQAKDDAHPYVVVLGTLSFDPGLLPKSHEPGAQTALLDAHFVGQILDGGPIDLPITLIARCYGPWCAAPSSDSPSLALLRETHSGYELDVNPCGGFLFSASDAALIHRARACLNGAAACVPNAPDAQK